MKDSSRDLLLLLPVAFLLAIAGGVPYFHPDFVHELVPAIARNWGNPDYFHYPALVLYLHALVYLPLCFVLSLLDGSLGPVELFIAAAKRGTLTPEYGISFYLPGQLITVSFSLLGVIATYLVTRSLTGRRWPAVVSGLFLCTCPLWVADSHYLTVDVPLAALCIITTKLSLDLLRGPTARSWKRAALLGLFVGLTGSAKYNGALIVAPALTAVAALHWPNRKRAAPYVGILVLSSTLTFLVCNPYVLLDWGHFWSDFKYELAHARDGHFGFTSAFGLLHHIRHTLYYGYGVLPLALGLLGACCMAVSGRLRRSDKAVFLVFPVVFYLFMASSRLAFMRYLVPVLPYLAVLSGMGVYFVGESLLKRFGEGLAPVRKTILAVICAAALLPNLWASWTHDRLLSRPDTREDLERMFDASGLHGQAHTMCAGYYTKVLLSPKWGDDIEDLTPDVWRDPPDLAVFDSFSHDRWLYERPDARWPRSEGASRSAVIQISPYRIPKDQAPFSPKSLYSPFAPDLKCREFPGPFIEIYCRERSLAQKLIGRGGWGTKVSVAPIGESYYFNQLK